jgi:dATP pyrophosphohydrolase
MSKAIVRVIDAYVFKKNKNNLEYLVLKRSPEKVYGGLWQCITGKIEQGEASWETAIRELREETGLSPKQIFIVDHISKFYEADEDRINLIPVFGIEVSDSKIELSDEHTEYRWVKFKIALKKLVWKGQKEGLKSLNNMLNSDDSRLYWSRVLI